MSGAAGRLALLAGALFDAGVPCEPLGDAAAPVLRVWLAGRPELGDSVTADEDDGVWCFRSSVGLPLGPCDEPEQVAATLAEVLRDPAPLLRSVRWGRR